eukprot:scaffold1890_cov380-Prasinococcus_capsulatus_cf.AAC.15
MEGRPSSHLHRSRYLQTVRATGPPAARRASVSARESVRRVWDTAARIRTPAVAATERSVAGLHVVRKGAPYC